MLKDYEIRDTSFFKFRFIYLFLKQVNFTVSFKFNFLQRIKMINNYSRHGVQ